MTHQSNDECGYLQGRGRRNLLGFNQCLHILQEIMFYFLSGRVLFELWQYSTTTKVGMICKVERV